MSFSLRALQAVCPPEHTWKDHAWGFYKIEQVQRQEVVTIAVLYKTNTKDRGLMLNICPWCEARIDHLNEEHRVKPRKAAA